MRISELLLEYKREITLKNYQNKIEQASARDTKLSAEEALVKLEQMDPTKKKSYTEWLTRQYVSGKFRLEDYPRVSDVLDKFINAKSRLPNKDINAYDFHKLESEMDRIYNVELEKDEEETSTGTFPVVPDSEVLYNGPLGQLSIPKTEEASKILGRGTKWCTAAEKNCMFNRYNMESPLYIWRDKNGEKYQFWFGDNQFQFMDSRDKELSTNTLNYFRSNHPVVSKLFKEEEKDLLLSKNPSKLANYARDVIRERWPEAENIIKKDAIPSYMYAREVLKNRWPEAETIILSNLNSAYGYALNVIKNRWPEAEKVLKKEPMLALEYAKYVLKNRWPEAEKIIVKDPMVWRSYIRYFPEAAKDN